METALLIGVIVVLVVVLARSSDQEKRLKKLEQELGFARQAYDGLAVRLWQAERALGDAIRRITAPAGSVGAPSPAAEHAEIAAPGPAEQAPSVAVIVEAALAASQDPAAPHAALPSPAPADWQPLPAGAPGTPTEWQPVPQAPVATATASVTVAAAAAAPAAASASASAADPSPPAGSPPAPPQPAPAPQDEPAPAGIDWEHWIGVRGAAALGAGILVIAGLYFFKYSIEKGFLTPTMRVVLGTLAGLACIGASERTLRKSHLVLANWLAGAGIAILYISFWAAKALYGLIPMQAAFVLMIVVTATCVLLAIRHGSLVIAMLGLLGGFVTPFALSSGSDHPIGLFGYLLLLNAGILATAYRRRWPLLSGVSFLATLLYEAVWIGDRMGDRLWLGMGIVVLFAAVFTFGVRPTPAETEDKGQNKAHDHGAWTRVAAALFPFAFGLYFSLRSDLGPHLYPVGAMLGVLAAGACFVARWQRVSWIAPAAAGASLAVVGAWIARHDPSAVTAEVVLFTGLLAVIFHAALEAERRWPSGAPRASSHAAAVASLGGMLLLLLAGVWPSAVSPFPWIAGWGFLAALTIRHAGFPGREPLHIGPAIALGLGIPTLHAAHFDDPLFPPPDIYVGVSLAIAVALQIVAFARRAPASRRWAGHAAALVALILLVEPLSFPQFSPASLILGAALALAILILIAATRLQSGVWVALAMLGTVFVHTMWTFLRDDLGVTPSLAWTALAWQCGAVLLFTAWPRLAPCVFRDEAWSWRAAALAGPLYFIALRRDFTIAVGESVIGLLPIALAAVTVGAALAARGLWERESDVRRTALAWLLAVTCGFVSVAIPLQLEKEWITVGWALEGAALLALFRRLDHPGLKYVGLAHLAVVTVRLVANPNVLEYHPASSLILLNWLAYAYWIPALCLLAGWRLLRALEVERLTDWEEGLYPRRLPLAAMGCALAAIVVLFVWLNLAILDAFTTGQTIEIAFEHRPARDLTLSMAWAIYALVLLTLGMIRDNAGLRWASLILILATLAKVFLYDLAHLQDLFRVASLVGLALSLIVISLAYQRFVFGKSSPRSS